MIAINLDSRGAASHTNNPYQSYERVVVPRTKGTTSLLRKHLASQPSNFLSLIHFLGFKNNSPLYVDIISTQHQET